VGGEGAAEYLSVARGGALPLRFLSVVAVQPVLEEMAGFGREVRPGSAVPNVPHGFCGDAIRASNRCAKPSILASAFHVVNFEHLLW
jgi:hypothetical protein